MPLARLFGSLRSRRRAHDPTQRWSGPPDATPIHTLLDQRGVPWRLTAADLVQRFGETDGRVEIPTAQPFLPGLVRPLSAALDPHAPRDRPATAFSALVRRSGDPAGDLRLTADEVSLYLGRVRIHRSGRAATALWRFGAASLELVATPDGCRVDIRLSD